MYDGLCKMLILHDTVLLLLRRFYASFEITTSRETQTNEFDLLFTAIMTGIIPILFRNYFRLKIGRNRKFLPVASPCVRSHSLENPQSKACGKNQKYVLLPTLIKIH